MKRTLWCVCSLTLLAGMVLLGRPATVRAAEGDNLDRIERLEQRVNQIAERQEQLMNRLGAPAERRAQLGPPDGPALRPQLASALPLSAQPVPPAVRAGKSIHDLIGWLCLIGMICNILLAIWIYTDIRKRGEGSGIFIALALVAGIPSALIYSLTRIGDRKP